MEKVKNQRRHKMKKPYFYDRNKIIQTGKITCAKDIAKAKGLVLQKAKEFFKENPLAKDVYVRLPGVCEKTFYRKDF